MSIEREPVRINSKIETMPECISNEQLQLVKLVKGVGQVIDESTQQCKENCKAGVQACKVVIKLDESVGVMPSLTAECGECPNPELVPKAAGSVIGYADALSRAVKDIKLNGPTLNEEDTERVDIEKWANNLFYYEDKENTPGFHIISDDDIDSLGFNKGQGFQLFQCLIRGGLANSPNINNAFIESAEIQDKFALRRQYFIVAERINGLIENESRLAVIPNFGEKKFEILRKIKEAVELADFDLIDTRDS